MNFTHPSLFIAGAACVAIPIIIHLLLRRRRRPVLWGAMRFIVEAHRRTRRRLRLERWLLLAARCLLVLLLGAAIARPLLNAAAGALGAPGSRTVYILIDNALASSVRDPAGPEEATALARHKDAASKLLDALTPADRAALIALGSPAMALVAPPSADRAAVRSLLEGLTPTDGGADLAGALDIVSRDLGSEDASALGSPTIVVLSDFLLGSADLARTLPALAGGPDGVEPKLIASKPAEQAPGNVQVVNVEPLRQVSLTGGRDSLAGEQVRIMLRRSGAATGESSTTTVRLSIVSASGGAPTAAGRVQARWAPGQTDLTATASLEPAGGSPVTGGFAAIIAEIDADAIAADNVFRRPVGVRDALRVAIVDRRRFGGAMRVDQMTPGEWIRLALRPSSTSPIEVVDLPPAAVDAAALSGLDVVFTPRPDLIDEPTWARLRRFASSGGLVVATPPQEANVHLWADAMSRGLGLDWRFAPEASDLSSPTRLAEQQPSNLFALLGAEWAALTRTADVSRTLAVEEIGPESRVLLALDGGAPWMIAASPSTPESAGDPVEHVESGEDGAAIERGAGLVVYIASAPTLEWTSIPAKPLMLPLIQELVRQGAGQSVASMAHVAGGRVLAPSRTAELTPIAQGRRQGGAEPASLLVDASGRVAEPARHGALWRALDDRGGTRGMLAVNADPLAGRVETQTAPSVQQWLAQALPGAASAEAATWLDERSLDAALDGAGEGSPATLPLLIGAAIVALLETMMARMFSHARAEAPAPGGRSVAQALEAAA